MKRRATVFLATAALWLGGCAMTEITPAKNEAERETIDQTPADTHRKKTTITITPALQTMAPVGWPLRLIASLPVMVGAAPPTPAPTSTTSTANPHQPTVKVEGDKQVVQINGQTIVADKGSTIKVEIDEATSEGGKNLTDRERASSAGQGGKSSGKGSIAIDGEAGAVGLSSGPSVGASKFGGRTKTLASSPTVTLYLLGGVLIAAGVVALVWLQQRAMGWAGIVSGVSVIAMAVLVDQFPWLFLVAGAITMIVAGVVVFRVYVLKKDGDISWETLKTVVKGVESAPAEAQSAVKGAIAAAGGSALSVKETILEAKAEVVA